VPKIAYDVMGEPSEFFGRLFSDPKLDQLMSRFLIDLANDVAYSRIVGEGTFSGVKPFNVVLSPIEKKLRALE
jgi:hypothetical protein